MTPDVILMDEPSIALDPRQSETADSIVKFFFSDKNYRVSRFGYDFEYL